MVEVQLEVIAGNTRAIRTYERAGFVRTRDLRILARPDNALTPELGGDVIAAATEQPLPHGARLRATRSRAWQRESASLAHLTGLSGPATDSAAAPTAYLLYRAGDECGSLTSPRRRSNWRHARRRAGEAIAGAHVAYRQRAGEPDLRRARSALGWRETLRQHEMSITF
ncbi:MAG: hypothetical protein U0232_26760 [Thermomicrobiales bacterium]